MLIEFKVKNFRSIKEEQTLSMVASRDKAHPGNLIDAPGGLKLLKAVGIYGANASGKSNLIKALGAMIGFVIDSATKMNVGDSISAAQPFLLDSKTKDEPSSFALSFALDGTVYEYSFGITHAHVLSERLTSESLGKTKVLFDRQGDGHTYVWKMEKSLATKETVGLLKERTRDNGLALSRGAELNIAQLSVVYLYLKGRFQTFDLSQVEGGTLFLMATAQRCLNDNGFKQKVRELLNDADIGIDDISITTLPPEIEISFRKALQESLSENYTDKYIKSFEKKLNFPRVPFLQSIHRTSDGKDAVSFDFAQQESNGTKRFFSLLAPILTSLSTGNAIVIDELECSLHPLLARKLIQYFQHPANNTTGAQLIFATQDATLMDAALFRRDQLWLVEKNREQASECFSLYDFDERPRNNEALQRNYLAGRYGGIPIFGRSLERLEDEAS